MNTSKKTDRINQLSCTIATQLPSRPVELLLSRLDGVRAGGEGRWYARCPAHEDRSPSLSIRDTGDRVLLHCFTGCEPDDVLAALSLSWRDLYPNPRECARRRPNEGAEKAFKRILARPDPLDHERMILYIAAADQRAGRTLSIEDRARVEVARERVAAAEGGL